MLFMSTQKLFENCGIDNVRGWTYSVGMKTTETNRRPGRPATGTTPKRYFRMDDESWVAVVAAAEASGESTSEYMRRVLLRDASRVLRRAGSE